MQHVIHVNDFTVGNACSYIAIYAFKPYYALSYNRMLACMQKTNNYADVCMYSYTHAHVCAHLWHGKAMHIHV